MNRLTLESLELPLCLEKSGMKHFILSVQKLKPPKEVELEILHNFKNLPRKVVNQKLFRVKWKFIYITDVLPLSWTHLSHRRCKLLMTGKIVDVDRSANLAFKGVSVLEVASAENFKFGKSGIDRCDVGREARSEVAENLRPYAVMRNVVQCRSRVEEVPFRSFLLISFSSDIAFVVDSRPFTQELSTAVPSSRRRAWASPTSFQRGFVHGKWFQYSKCQFAKAYMCNPWIKSRIKGSLLSVVTWSPVSLM